SVGMNHAQEHRAALNASAQSFVDLYEATDPALRHQLGLFHRPLGGGTLLVAASVNHLMLNRLIGSTPSSIEEAVATFRDRGVSRYLLTFDREEFDTALAYGQRHGLVRYRRPWSTLIRRSLDNKPLPDLTEPEGVTIREARDSDRHALGALLTSAFDMPKHSSVIFSSAVNRPGWLALVAEVEQDLAGAGLLFMHEGCA